MKLFNPVSAGGGGKGTVAKERNKYSTLVEQRCSSDHMAVRAAPHWRLGKVHGQAGSTPLTIARFFPLLLLPHPVCNARHFHLVSNGHRSQKSPSACSVAPCHAVKKITRPCSSSSLWWMDGLERQMWQHLSQLAKVARHCTPITRYPVALWTGDRLHPSTCNYFSLYIGPCHSLHIGPCHPRSLYIGPCRPLGGRQPPNSVIFLNWHIFLNFFIFKYKNKKKARRSACLKSSGPSATSATTSSPTSPRSWNPLRIAILQRLRAIWG